VTPQDIRGPTYFERLLSAVSVLTLLDFTLVTVFDYDSSWSSPYLTAIDFSHDTAIRVLSLNQIAREHMLDCLNK
jgi:hypothetical protein